MAPVVRTFFDPATFTATHLVSDPKSRACAIIDPVLDFEPRGAKLSTGSLDAVLEAVREGGLELKWVLETHAHADHLTGADVIRRRTGAKVAIGSGIRQVQALFADRFEADDVTPDGSGFDRLLEDGDVLELGELEIRAMATPGHTASCMTFVVGDAAFIGDTMFMPDYGSARTDFPGGDAATLYRSIRKILALPSETRLFVGHDYLPTGRTTYQWETTVREQRTSNIHVPDGVSEAEFVAMRRARDATLSPPALIYPSLQVNIRAGALPPPSARGRVFLKTPVSWA